MEWDIFLSTFGLIFLAELGDKTQLAVLTQTCKFRRPWAVFFGAALGLIAVTALGAAGGQLLGQLIPAGVLKNLAAVAFVVMGILIARETLGQEAREETPEGETCGDGAKSSSWAAFGSTLALLFVAEMGDKTQLAVLSVAGKEANPWPVFIGGALALTAVTALGVVCGRGLCALIPQRLLLRLSAVAFVIMGILIGLGVL